jgi:hypothetical protein
VKYQEKTIIFGEGNIKTAAVSRFKVYLGTLAFPWRNLGKTVKKTKARIIDGNVEIRKRFPG